MSDANSSPRSASEDAHADLDAALTGDAPFDGAREADGAAGVPPQYGVGPFTIREVSLIGVWLVAFIVSFFSVWVDGTGTALGSVWNSGIDWVLTIGVPTVAVFLIVLRRFSPDGIRRVGSLAIDQFASVAFSVSAVVWLGILWANIVRGTQTGIWLSSWVVWVEFLLMLAGVVLTVAAPFIRPFDEDFRGRTGVPAHRNARPVRAVTPRPAVERPVTADPSPYAAAPASAPSAGEAYTPLVTSDPSFAPHSAAAATAASAADEPVPAPQSAATDETAAFSFAVQDDEPVVDVAPPASQAFWALSPVDRDVVDENGFPIFTVGPTAWALVIEDRGDSFVVRHEDGRVGYLTDVSGVTRG